MAFEDKTQNNIMIDLKAAIEPDTSTEEGTLIDHSFRGAAAEFEKAYIELELIDQNGYAETADRDNKKSIAEIAQEVVAGKWGNGSERKQRLEAEGYDYAEVQAKVNEMLR